jgi:hypothetical protein
MREERPIIIMDRTNPSEWKREMDGWTLLFIITHTLMIMMNSDPDAAMLHVCRRR